MGGWGKPRNGGAGALWLVSLGVPLHVYPILLQRTQRARLVGLIEREAAG